MKVSAIATPLALPDDAKELETLLARFPHHCDLWHAHALIQTDPARAIESVSRAITLAARYHPLIHFESSSLWWLAAQHHHRLGEAAPAIAACDKAIFQDHHNGPALALRREYALANGEAALAARHGATLARLPAMQGYDEALESFADWDAAITPAGQPPQHPPLPADLEAHDDAWRAKDIRRMEEVAAALPHHPLPARQLARWHFAGAAACGGWLAEGLSRLESWHRRYHVEAARHFALRATLFEQQGEAELARNDWRKSWDLDGNAEAKAQLA